MINLLLLLVFLACIGLTAAWMAENPGSVTIHWFDYRIDTSFAFLMVTALVAAFVIAYAWILIRRVMLAPVYFSERRSLKHYRKGLAAITQSIAALAAADSKTALTYTRKAEKLLGRTPLVLLLSAQIARTQGDDGKTRMLLTQMLDHEETEYLAARSLAEFASKQQLFPKALELAKRAQAINPADIAALISLHIRLKQWQEAMLAIDKAVRKGKISRNAMRHYKGLVHLQQGTELLAAGQTDGALAAAHFTLKELPGFIPAIIFAANAFAASRHQRKAIHLLFSAWKKTPHPQLAGALRSVLAAEPKERQAKLMRKWAAIRREPPLSDTAWVCGACAQASPEWHTHCPACGEFDKMEWKKREIKFAA